MIKLIRLLCTGEVERFLLLGGSPGDVHGLELVKASEHTGAGHTSQHVSSSSLHHRHETFVLEDLHSAVKGTLVLDSATGGHHHSPPDGVNWVGHESSCDGGGVKYKGSLDCGMQILKNEAFMSMMKGAGARR